MNRREAMKTITLGAVLPVLQHEHPVPAEKPAPQLKFFTPEQNDFVAQLAELIIPQTATSGARRTGVHLYIDQVLSASSQDEQKSFLDGLKWLDARAQQLHGESFMKLAEAEQEALLEPLATGKNKNAEDQPGVRFFERMKALTVTGYYTSSDGYMAELGYTIGFTGDFPGCTHPDESHE